MGIAGAGWQFNSVQKAKMTPKKWGFTDKDDGSISIILNGRELGKYGQKILGFGCNLVLVAIFVIIFGIIIGLKIAKLL